jgi:polysaccharide export outer membrane protein
MKSGTFLVAVLIAATLPCQAQDKPPADPQAEHTAPAPEAPKAPAAEASKPLAPAPAAAAPTSSDSFVIGASDTITVTVLKEPSESGPLLVRPDGKITVPLLGDIQAAGLTPLQLADELTKALKKYIQDPNVSVILTKVNSQKVYLIGEIARIGPLDVTPGMTLLEAISSAGGLTQYANVKKIYILRNADGKTEKLPVRYKDALKGNTALNLVLKPGDTIVVP